MPSPDIAPEAGTGPGAAVGRLILEAERQEGRAPAELFTALYQELHRLARHQLRGRNVTVSPTTLLHEAYVGLAAREPRFPDRARFVAYAARAMRGLIIDHARARRALKRGGEFHLTTLDTASQDRPQEDLPALGDALDALAASDPRLAELVDLKFFCGFSLREIAGMRGVSERTVQRDWTKARLYLHRALSR
ncbi:MAG TPA: ECF-type sigma factor [Anaeromyxobacteraceae bacterium]|nr:ECF-type sigma factor [Anaeromyxobacteraceae bacterium]